MNYLSKLLSIEERLDKLRVDSSEHAEYLDKLKRERELDDFAKELAYENLSQSDRRRIFDQINSSKNFLNQSQSYGMNGGIDQKDSPDALYLITAVAFGCLGLIFGWKFKGMYESSITDEVEKLSKLIIEGLKDEDVGR